MDTKKESPTRIEAVIAGYEEGVKAGRAAALKEIAEKIRGMERNLPERERYGSGQGMYNAAITDILSLLQEP